MKIIFIQLFKAILRAIYCPIKLFKTKNRVVYLSRQSNNKSIDMILLEEEIKKQNQSVDQIFRLKTIDGGIIAKIKYCFYLIGDMYYVSTSKVAILDTYSITISCLKHKKSLKVVQIWHALGAIKQFGLQSVGSKEGRDEKVSLTMCMHKNYDYILSPSHATTQFYKKAFGYDDNYFKYIPLPRVDDILTDKGIASKFYELNPNLKDKKIILYLPTFREDEANIVESLKNCFSNKDEFYLLISPHPLFSQVKRDLKYFYNGEFSTYDLMKVADSIITDYSACAIEASLLEKPLYFYVPDFKKYNLERGININLKEELPSATFEDENKLYYSIVNQNYNIESLINFKNKYVEYSKPNCSELLAKFINNLLKEN